MYDAIYHCKHQDYDREIAFLIDNIEETIAYCISKHYSEHEFFLNNKRIFNQKQHQKSTRWFINFLKDDVNWIKRIPHFCISISVVQKDRLVISVVYDPMLNETFYAHQGSGARLNQYRLRIQDKRTISSTSRSPIVLSINQIFQEDMEYLTIYSDVLNVLLKACSVRITGSIDLDLAYVAANRIDAMVLMGNEKMIEGEIHNASLIVKEAGGTITYGYCSEKKEEKPFKKNTTEKDQHVHFLQIVCAGEPQTVGLIAELLQSKFDVIHFKT
ncbi:inositol monophosphatase family protein [Candidatus Riesia pediculischaeffi]|nr:inositol monophosphatase family protein [Candidatus Riesia pediculischaeffi]